MLSRRARIALATALMLAGCSAASPITTPTASVTSEPSVPLTATAAPPPTATPLPLAPGFIAGESFKVGSDPGNVAVADLNGDGSLDLVTTRSYDGTPGTASKGEISILFGHGDGSFNPPVSVAGPQADFIAAVDINGDAIPDLVAASGPAVAVMMGKGDGSFLAPVRYPVQGSLAYAWAYSLATGDLNNDGAPDLLVSAYGRFGPNPSTPGQIAVLLNKGHGTFADAVFYADRAAFGVTAADFNGDGKLDAATASFDGTVRIFDGDGSGRLGAPSELGIGAQGVAIVAGDVNHDGKPDLLTGNDNSHSVSVLISQGDGSFGAAQSLAAGNTYSVAMADLDGDGRIDLLAGGSGEHVIDFWRGGADGAFVITAGIDIGDASARGVAAADFNSDGKLDLVVDCAACRIEPGTVGTVSAVYIFLAK